MSIRRTYITSRSKPRGGKIYNTTPDVAHVLVEALTLHAPGGMFTWGVRTLEVGSERILNVECSFVEATLRQRDLNFHGQTTGRRYFTWKYGEIAFGMIHTIIRPLTSTTVRAELILIVPLSVGSHR